MVKTRSGVCYFKPRKGWQKLIVNLVDNEHGWNGTVVRVFGPWEAILKSVCGLVPLSWNMDPTFQVPEPSSEEARDRALKLYEIPYDNHN